MEKTFREVLRDIKPGEVWESSAIRVYFNDDNLKINWLETICEKASFVLVGMEDLFTVKRKVFDFATAMEAYKQGKEIESNYSYYRYKIMDGRDCCYKYGEWVDYGEYMSPKIEMNEIRGEWFINE